MCLEKGPKNALVHAAAAQAVMMSLLMILKASLLDTFMVDALKRGAGMILESIAVLGLLDSPRQRS